MMTAQKGDTFASLFKKYRLRSEIETLSQFGDLLAQEGLVYESSLFTHWQKGDRVPSEIRTVIKITEIFVKRGGIRTLSEIKTFVATTQVRALSTEELKRIDGILCSKELEHINRISETKIEVDTNFFRVISLHLPSTLLTGFYIGLLLWWVSLNVYGLRSSPLNFAFGFAFGLVPLYGGFTGLLSLNKFSAKKTYLKQAIGFFAAGLITWGVGQMIWCVYNFFLNVEVPYPALSDVGFIISWPLWGVGMYYLARSTRTQHASKVKVSKIPIVILSLVSIVVTSYLLVFVARKGEIITSLDGLTIFFDLAYPLLDIALIVEAIVLYGSSFMYVRKMYRWPVYIILTSIVLNFFGDFGFSYTTRMKEYFNGNWVDLTFTTTFYLVSVAINSFKAMENFAILQTKNHKSALNRDYRLRYASLLGMKWIKKLGERVRA